MNARSNGAVHVLVTLAKMTASTWEPDSTWMDEPQIRVKQSDCHPEQRT